MVRVNWNCGVEYQSQMLTLTVHEPVVFSDALGMSRESVLILNFFSVRIQNQIEDSFAFSYNGNVSINHQSKQFYSEQLTKNEFRIMKNARFQRLILFTSHSGLYSRAE